MKHNGPVIVAIDDNKDNLVALNAFVVDAFPGVSVFSALDGRHGIELAREKDPDVVLLDILMPGMDGFEVCRQLKADPHLSHIPVVFLTALKDDRKSRIRALEVGGEAFISKPFDEAELTAQIRAMVKIKAAGEREWREKERLAGLVVDRTSQLEKELTERKKAEMELGETNQVLEKNKTAMINLLEDLKEEIEARKNSEAALRGSEEKYRTYIDNSPEAIFIVDTEGNYQDANPSACSMFGYSREEILTLSIRDLVPAGTGKGRFAGFLKLKETGSLTTEAMLVKKNGDSLSVILNAVQLPDNRYLGFCTDITGRKLAEDTLVRVNQKLNVLSDLTRRDLVNQVFILNSYLELAKKQAAGQESTLAGIQKIEQSVRSINEITEISKDYQDMGAKPPSWQNVNMVLLFGLSHISIGEIQHSLETETLEIFADPLLEKAFQGLFENSIAHGDHVTRIRAAYRATPDGVVIVFEDNGPGIPQEKKELIFLRGGSARASVRGLFFIREILDITGITIREAGEPGKGARFEISVPKGMWRTGGVKETPFSPLS
ncbi:MAG: response regulator [Methanomicrobiales archaeon]|nr:response regulator [Methanomicrobiales archaeon]